jgi:hypothetical protein
MPDIGELLGRELSAAVIMFHETVAARPHRQRRRGGQFPGGRGRNTPGYAANESAAIDVARHTLAAVEFR